MPCGFRSKFLDRIMLEKINILKQGGTKRPRRTISLLELCTEEGRRAAGRHTLDPCASVKKQAQ